MSKLESKISKAGIASAFVVSGDIDDWITIRSVSDPNRMNTLPGQAF